ncbi:hypothetical protein ACES2F_10790 [Bdellovibrio bacteriovorus]|uniref:hypothetical protein n=1 Tax=Bdellovibrio bacteriovorus TaxID=959 RepID=UPI0035A6254E
MAIVSSRGTSSGLNRRRTLCGSRHRGAGEGLASDDIHKALPQRESCADAYFVSSNCLEDCSFEMLYMTSWSAFFWLWI